MQVVVIAQGVPQFNMTASLVSLWIQKYLQIGFYTGCIFQQSFFDFFFPSTTLIEREHLILMIQTHDASNIYQAFSLEKLPRSSVAQTKHGAWCEALIAAPKELLPPKKKKKKWNSSSCSFEEV